MTGVEPEEPTAETSPETGSPAGLLQTVTVQDVGAGSTTPPSSEQLPTARYDLRVFQSLRRIIRAVDLHSRKLSAQHKITGPQLVCLLAVDEHEPVTGSTIARHVYLSPSTVIGILDRLEAKGLIRRERDPKDRRLVQVSLAEQGRALVKSAPSPLQDRLAEAMNKLPEAKQTRIAGALDQIVEMMEVRDVDAAPILETGPIAPVNGGGEAAEPSSDGQPGR
jgi:DNA-binding MarR family transcriptional regulator